MNKEKIKNLYKEYKGITLIALVVTILVLLILVGVAISTLTGENGIIAKAKSAKQETERAEQEENTTIGEYQNYINKYIVSDSGESSSLTNEAIKQLKEEIKIDVKNEIRDEMKGEILEQVYPIGYVYISTEDTNPEDIFGGTWEQYGQGRTLIGAGTNAGYTFTVGNTGTTVGATTNPLGEYFHKLTVAEMPSHNHGYMRQKLLDADPAADSNSGRGCLDLTMGIKVNVNTYNAGGNGSHNNLQPYIVTYMWRKTAN